MEGKVARGKQGGVGKPGESGWENYIQIKRNAIASNSNGISTPKSIQVGNRINKTKHSEQEKPEDSMPESLEVGVVIPTQCVLSFCCLNTDHILVSPLPACLSPAKPCGCTWQPLWACTTFCAGTGRGRW